MKTILARLSAFLLAAGLLCGATPLGADENAYHVTGRAYSVDVRHFVVNHLPAQTIVTVDQKVALGKGFTDILSTCPGKLVEIYCAPAIFLEKCDLVEEPYAFQLSPGVAVFGSTWRCSIPNAGPCVEVSGHLVSKDQPELEDVQPASNCAF
jgi:hypothetical protein